MLVSNVKTYTHEEWKDEHDRLTKMVAGDIDQVTKTRYMDKLIKLELSGTYQRYFNQPRALLESLIRDIKQLFISYDRTDLIDQSDELRFFMYKINEITSEIQQMTRRLFSAGKNKHRVICCISLVISLILYMKKRNSSL